MQPSPPGGGRATQTKLRRPDEPVMTNPFLDGNDPTPEEQAAVLNFTEHVDAAINQAGGIRQFLQRPPTPASRRPRRGRLVLHDPDAPAPPGPWSMPFRGDVS